MKVKSLFILVFGLSLALAALAQDIQTKGSISGQVIDINKAVVPGATVTINGPQGEVTTTTNDEGIYRVDNLIPGSYTIKVEQTGFKSISISNVTVFVGKTATENVSLELGNISEVVNVVAGAEIDQASTATSSNLNDQLYQNIPVARGVSPVYSRAGYDDGCWRRLGQR